MKRAVYLSILFCCLIYTAKAQTKNIKNDVFWNTTNGSPVYSQGGGVFSFPDPRTGKKKFYWYGVHYL